MSAFCLFLFLCSILSGKGITGNIPSELTKLPGLVELYGLSTPCFFLFFLMLV